jgi:hypothetical protein
MSSEFPELTADGAVRLSADVINLYGLHGDNYAAFCRACKVVDEAMAKRDDEEERRLDRVRFLLSCAVQAEPLNRELALAFEARAANVLAGVIHRRDAKDLA